MIKHLFVLFLIWGCGKPIVDKTLSSEERNSILTGVSENIILDTRMSANFDLLPLKGEVKKSGKFWSGDSWRLDRGSINNRWNTASKEGFGYRSPTRREAFTMPVDKIKTLSPSEKYDLFMGRYDYPLKNEVDFYARLGTASWEGICHGWAGATLNHEEPGPVVKINPDGIEIHFGASDIKALLSYAYSKILIRDEESIGKRCDEDDGDSTNENCDDDLSAESFHVVLANKLGLRGQSVILDIDRYREVWNHPVTKYESILEKMFSTPKGKKAIVRTKITYVDVVQKNSWQKHTPVYSHMTTRYELDIDTNGNIVKGKWLSKERPDFIWTIPKAEYFEGYLSGIKKLLK